MAAKWTIAGTSVGVLLLMTAGGASAAPMVGQVRVVLQNPDVAPLAVVARAQAEVTRLYSLIGVMIVWVNEPVDDPRVVRVKVTNWEPSDSSMGPGALGVTYRVERGTSRALVIWSRGQRTATRSAVGLDAMLAVAIAHELGHVLLPAGSHEKRGLMRAEWDQNDLRDAAAGLLHFSRESAVMIVRAVKSGV